ncbi:MAG TPA: hypothetical protein VKD90_04210 [Gemmataceae bacterium]|nr:hypothetical protein [Gemmataceae bacterium]
MGTSRLLLCLIILISATAAGPAQDRGLLAGDKGWTVVKSEEAPPGTKIHFGADGKLTLTFRVDGQPRSVNGTYTLTGNQLTLKLAHDGRERVETRTVKKLTDAVLITEDKNRKVEELQRDR